MESHMLLFLFSLATGLFGAVHGAPEDKVPDSLKDYAFPDGFLFGTATSSYQVEGAWLEDGKSLNIWDTLTHNKSNLISDRSNGDVACDSYHKYKEDVQLLKELGVNFYRFSVSWSRILPTGHINVVNQAGIDYYNNLINELLANGIQPMVTMYHWDLPQTLQDLGGWPNQVMAQYFEDYARVLFTNYGDRVKYWITFNEPSVFTAGYESVAFHAPNVGATGFGQYLATHTVLKAHARAYHLYDNEFRAAQQGKIGMAFNINWCEPRDNITEDIAACNRMQEFNLGMYAHPVFSPEGDFPTVVKERVAMNSEAEGFTQSRLPSLTQEEIEYIKGTADFFGLNHYTTFYGSPLTYTGEPTFTKDVGILMMPDFSWPGSASIWLHVVPWGFRKQLNRIAEIYNNPPVIITENGFSDHGELNDTGRINYLTSYLTEMLNAIHEDGCNVVGYTAWSLIDNFEWNNGYTQRFGLYHVDFEDPNRARTIKESAKVYAEIIATKQIPERFREE
uniref:beta-glucosidase n=1 Tax=Periplaneta americana TaxID=6978 RepID=A0A059WHP2_PERAM|nr:beta-glucosidase [Periplaneta americana]